MVRERDWTESLASISSLTKVLKDDPSPVGSRTVIHELLWELAHLPGTLPRRRSTRARADHMLHDAVEMLNRQFAAEGPDELLLLAHKANDALRQLDKPGEWTLRIQIPVPQPPDDNQSDFELGELSFSARAVSAEASYMIKWGLGILLALPIAELILIYALEMMPSRSGPEGPASRTIATWNEVALVLAPVRLTLLPMGALVVTMLTMLADPNRNNIQSMFTDRVQSVILTRIASVGLITMAVITIASTPLRLSTQATGEWLVSLLLTSLLVALLSSIKTTWEQRIIELEKLNKEIRELETLLKNISTADTSRQWRDSVLVRPSRSTIAIMAVFICPMSFSLHRLSWHLELLVITPLTLVLSMIMLELTTRMHLTALAQKKQTETGTKRLRPRLWMAYAPLLMFTFVLGLSSVPFAAFGLVGLIAFIAAAMAASAWYWRDYPEREENRAQRYEASHWRRQLASCQHALESHRKYLR